MLRPLPASHRQSGYSLVPLQCTSIDPPQGIPNPDGHSPQQRQLGGLVQLKAHKRGQHTSEPRPPSARFMHASSSRNARKSRSPADARVCGTPVRPATRLSHSGSLPRFHGSPVAPSQPTLTHALAECPCIRCPPASPCPGRRSWTVEPHGCCGTVCMASGRGTPPLWRRRGRSSPAGKKPVQCWNAASVIAAAASRMPRVSSGGVAHRLNGTPHTRSSSWKARPLLRCRYSIATLGPSPAPPGPQDGTHAWTRCGTAAAHRPLEVRRAGPGWARGPRPAAVHAAAVTNAACSCGSEASRISTGAPASGAGMPMGNPVAEAHAAGRHPLSRHSAMVHSQWCCKASGKVGSEGAPGLCAAWSCFGRRSSLAATSADAAATTCPGHR